MMREDVEGKEKLKETDDRLNEHLARQIEAEDRKRKLNDGDEESSEGVQNNPEGMEVIMDQEEIMTDTVEDPSAGSSGDIRPRPSRGPGNLNPKIVWLWRLTQFR